VADQVTPAVEKTPEEIEREMLQTRESLTEKVTALENQVVGTVQTAADTISGTVDAVRSFVSSAPETVSETFKQATAAVSESMKGVFDISAHVRQNPWTAVGVSALLGGIVGYLTASRRESFSALAVASPLAPQPAAAPSAPREPGIADEFMGMISGKLKELAETAINSVSASLKSNIETGVPRLVDEAATALADKASGADASPSPPGSMPVAIPHKAGRICALRDWERGGLEPGHEACRGRGSCESWGSYSLLSGQWPSAGKGSVTSQRKRSVTARLRCGARRKEPSGCRRT